MAQDKVEVERLEVGGSTFRVHVGPSVWLQRAFTFKRDMLLSLSGLEAYRPETSGLYLLKKWGWGLFYISR